MIAKELGAIDKTWSFPEWQYNVKVLVDIKGFLGYQNMDVILIKQEIENKFKLNELLKDDFNIKIIPENNLISVTLTLPYLYLLRFRTFSIQKLIVSCS